MKLLLDTHTFLWSLDNNSKLSRLARELISDPSNKLHLSVASFWEATINIALGRYDVPGKSVSFLIQRAEQSRLVILPIQPAHLFALETMHRGERGEHRDPFDRLMVAQAIAEGMTLLSADKELHQYQAQIMW